MKKNAAFSFLALFTFTTAVIFAEGKAEPTRIRFAKGKSSKVLKGTLSGDQEQEFVFGAKKGQTVFITNTDSDKFAYRVFNENGINKESTELAKFSITLAIE